jgi:hypothetical protein
MFAWDFSETHRSGGGQSERATGVTPSGKIVTMRASNSSLVIPSDLDDEAVAILTRIADALQKHAP